MNKNQNRNKNKIVSDDILKQFAYNLYFLMITNNMTYTDISDAIGVHPETIRNWTLAKNTPNVSAIIKLSKLFNIKADQLIGLEKINNQYCK